MPLIDHAHFCANLALKWMLIHKISSKIDFFLPGLCGTTPTYLKRLGGGGGGGGGGGAEHLVHNNKACCYGN